jgi:glycosyltransferase involved in cell wall biosynthesis
MRPNPIPSPTILQVLPALNQGGVERGTIEIDHALSARGWTSLVVSAGGRLTAELKGRHLPMRIDAKRWHKIAGNALRLKRIIEAEGVDIVHARSRAPAWAAYLATRMTGTAFLTTFHGTYDNRSARRRFYNSVMVRGDRVIAVSNFIARHIIADYGVDPAKVTIIPRGADIEKFQPEAAPQPIELPDRRPVVMLPGRLTHWKGQHVFIEAMRLVDALGVIIGDVQDKAYAAALRRSLPGNVTILPGTTDMPGMLAHADVVVSASIQPEAFGRIAVEAQAMGRPVVATRLGGALETVIDGETGRLVPPSDPGAMAAAISDMLAERQVCRDACLRNAARYSVAQMCESELALYETVLASRALGVTQKRRLGEMRAAAPDPS